MNKYKLMKKKILLLLITLSIVVPLNAQLTISGHVIDSLGVGISAQEINIQVSGMGTMTIYSSSSGSFFYSDSSFFCTSCDIVFSSIDCNGMLLSWTYLYAPYLEVNLMMCGGNSTFCNAEFGYLSVGVNYEFEFYDVSYPVPDSWDWNFGDGTSDSVPNPLHNFSVAGAYDVCLTIYTSAGCTDTYCETLIIDSTIQAYCEAMFIYYLDTISGLSNSYQFIDQSSSSGIITDWLWDFGDGNISFQQNPLHSYTNCGTYNVSLSISTADSCTSIYEYILIVTGSQQSFLISGLVNVDSLPLNSGIVLLFGGSQMYTTTINQGNYMFSGLAEDSYIVYAMPDFQQNPFVLPTYYENSLYWNSANEIFLNADFNSADIQMNNYYSEYSGPGLISGILFFGNSKKCSERYVRKLNESLADISIMLMNLNDELLTHIITDVSGHFVFNNLPFNTYKLYVELTGYNTSPAIFTVNEDCSIIENIEIIISDDSISFATGINETIVNNDMIDIYPNPVFDVLNITFYSHFQGLVSLSIFNAIGQNVYTQQIETLLNMNNYQVNVSDLPKGVYYISINSRNELKYSKSFVK